MTESPFLRPPRIERVPVPIRVEELDRCLRRHPDAFLLESGLDRGGMGTWHVAGAHAIGEFIARGARWEYRLGADRQEGEGDPWHALDAWWRSWSAEPAMEDGRDLELPMLGGAVGYLGYELGEWIEGLTPGAAPRPHPDAHFKLYDEVLLVHGSTGEAYFVHRDRPRCQARRFWEVGGTDPDADTRVASDARSGTVPGTVSADARSGTVPGTVSDDTASLGRDAYLAAVEEIREGIRTGEVYEVNLTRCHRMAWSGSAWDLHGRLRVEQPVPYGAVLPWRPLAVVSASPERFLRRRGDQVETRPIKGTVPRGETDRQDEENAARLLASEKERAELAMIIDLERNDLGKVCVPGSVEVVAEADVEAYATVLHTVATVRGVLEKETTPVQLLQATFPGGSITGAPKWAAMRFIQDIEPVPRSVYTGSVGWIGPNGDLDLSIAIRTVLLTEDEVFFSVGGAVTWDSVGERELEELEAKGRAVFRALLSDSCRDGSPP